MARLSFSYILVTLAICLQWSQTGAILRYIDDSFGDEITEVEPVYLPGSDRVWTTAGASCAVECDPSQLPFNGTYMEYYSNSTKATPATVNFSFNGTSIEIFIFTSDVKSDPSGPELVMDTYLNFLIDGAPAGTFTHKSNGTGDPRSFTDGLNYYVSAFKQTGLPLKNHSFVIQNIGVSHLWFDYAQYDDGKPDPNPAPASVTNAASGGKASGFGTATAKDPTNTNDAAASSTSSSNPATHTSTGLVIKAAAAATAAVLLLIGAVIAFICWRRKNRRPANVGYGNFGHNTPMTPVFIPNSEKPQGIHYSNLTQHNVMFPPNTSPSAPLPYNQSNYSGGYNGSWNQGPDSTSYNMTPAYPATGYPNSYPPPPQPSFPEPMSDNALGLQAGPPRPPTANSSSPPPPSPQPTVSTLVPGAGYVLEPPTDGLSDAVRAKQAEREAEYARYAREREEALLARANSSNAGSSQEYSYDAPQASGSILQPPTDPSSAAIRAKQAEREAEYARYMQQRNDPMRAAGSSQQYSSNIHRTPSTRSSTHSHVSAMDSSDQQAMQAEMERLREQMLRIQAVQNQVVAELGAAPPPLYSERSGPGAAR